MQASDKELQALKVLQADLQQTHQNIWGIHWSMQGTEFLANHPFLDEPLDEIDEMVDWVAERIVQLGGVPLCAFDDILSNTTISKVNSEMHDMPDSMAAINNTLESLDGSMQITRTNLDDTDTATASQLDSYLGTIEKYQWMIRSTQVMKNK